LQYGNRETYDVVPDALLHNDAEDRAQRIARLTRERIARKHEICVTYGALDIVTAVISRHTPFVSTASCDGNKIFWRLLAASSPRLSKYQLTWTCDLLGVHGHQKVSSKDKTNSDS